MPIARTLIAATALLAACAGATTYYNPSTGQTISALAPADNADLAACRAEYQAAFARGPQLWQGEIVPDCMEKRGWIRK